MDVIQQSRAAASPLYPPTVPAPQKPLGLFRFLFQVVRNPLLAVPQAVYEQPLFVYRRSDTSGVVWITDPSLVERVLLHEHESFLKTDVEKRVFQPTLGHGILTAEGAAWKWQRRTAAPLFRHQDLTGHLPTFTAVADETLERWRKSGAGHVQPVDRDMTDATYSVITRTILAGTRPHEDAAIKRAANSLLSWTSWEVAFAMLRIPTSVWHPGQRPSRRAAAELRGTVSALLARRRGEAASSPGANATDLLGRLIAARDPETDAPMSDEQAIDNLLTFLLAGHETTAKALTWALYLAARAPEWQTRIREEVRAVCGAGPVEATHLERLVVTRAFLKETMRLYPPVPVMSRQVGRGLELGGWKLGRGTLIIIPVFAMHRHRRLWDDPDRFDPERFFPAAEAKHLRTQFMPFGFGPRTCIGMAFAMLEATAVFATLIRGARFDWDGRHLPQPVSRVTLRPKGGMPLAVTVLGPINSSS